MPALEIWNSASIPWSGLTFWLTDQLICLCLILSSSCTTRMTPRRPRPASSSRALLPRPRPVRPASRARARPARRLPPWQQQQLRRHRGRGVRGMPRHLHLLMPPLNWEQQLQHPVCAAGVFHISLTVLFFLSSTFIFPQCGFMLPKIAKSSRSVAFFGSFLSDS